MEHSENSVTAIIQARVDSKRLPSKALLPLGGKPLISHVIERAKSIKGCGPVILATGDDHVNYPLAEIAENCGIDFFFGSVENVLERYYLAAEKSGGEYIIRITGDNPFTDPFYAALTVENAVSEKTDLCSPGGLPLGTAVEVIKRSALIECYEKSRMPHQFEHVTPYIKENPDRFNIVRFPADIQVEARDLRLTIDTPEDYELAKYIYEKLPEGSAVNLDRIMELYFKDRNAFMINRHVKQRPLNHSGK